MQKPVTPSWSEVVDGLVCRWAMAPDTSATAWSRFRAIISLPASSGSVVVSPWYRSGARATKPSAAKRSHTSLMWGTSPHHSWITIRPGPTPRSGTAM